MSLGLLLPAALAALAALIVPLLLHLARRAEQKPTDFAALRWLRAMPRPRQKLRFEEWALLALRLLLVALVALFLAQPVLYGGQGDQPWLAVAPGVDVEQATKATADLESPRRHWLAPGFPALDATSDPGPVAFSSLLRELDATLPSGTRLVVVVPEILDGLDAERPRLSRRVDWRVLPGRAAMPKPGATPAKLPPTLVVRHAPDRGQATRYLRAAAKAWQGTAETAATTQALPDDARWLVWLAPGALPAAVHDWIERGGVALLDAGAEDAVDDQAAVAWRDEHGAVLAREQARGRGRVVKLTQPLAPGTMPVLLDPTFPEQLRRLFEGPPASPTAAYAETQVPLTGGPRFPETPRPLQPWLAIVIAALFVVERWFASASRPRLSP